MWQCRVTAEFPERNENEKNEKNQVLKREIAITWSMRKLKITGDLGALGAISNNWLLKIHIR